MKNAPIVKMFLRDLILIRTIAEKNGIEIDNKKLVNNLATTYNKAGRHAKKDDPRWVRKGREIRKMADNLKITNKEIAAAIGTSYATVADTYKPIKKTSYKRQNQVFEYLKNMEEKSKC